MKSYRTIERLLRRYLVLIATVTKRQIVSSPFVFKFALVSGLWGHNSIEQAQSSARV